MDDDQRFAALETKLDSLLKLINRDLEEIKHMVLEHEALLKGSDTRLGMLVRLEILWRSYTWILCTLSATIGAFVTWIVTRLTQ